MLVGAPSPSTPCHLLRLLDRFLDRADHVEGLLRHVVVLAVDDLPEARDRVGNRHVLAGDARELLGDEERLRQELLDLAGARHRQLVLLGELVDAEDRDDVLQVLVALQHLLHRPGDVVVLVADDSRVEDARRRGQRIDGRIDAELDDRARQVGRRVEVRERRRRGRVGVVVGRHVDRLDRGDRALLRRGDALLELAHLGQQRRLVADRATACGRAAPTLPSPPA